MTSYGSASYGVDSYGQADGAGTPTVGPLAWTPAYSALAGPVAARGLPDQADLDVTTGVLGRDALGNLGLVRGGERAVSAIVRALLTPKGSNWFDPQYGSQALPGQTVKNGLLLQTADAVLYELRRGSRLFSGSVRVDVDEDPADPRRVTITVTAQASGGAPPISFPFSVPGGVA